MTGTTTADRSGLRDHGWRIARRDALTDWSESRLVDPTKLTPSGEGR